MSSTEHAAEDAQWNEPLDERERELMDPDHWDESTTVVGTSAPNPTLTIGIRLERDDISILSAAAEAADMPLSRYILKVALEAAKRSPNVIPGRDTTKRKGAA